MFNLGFSEMLLLAAIGLIFIGPKELPELARILGRTIRELKKAMAEVTSTVVLDLDKEPDRKAQVLPGKSVVTPREASTATHEIQGTSIAPSAEEGKMGNPATTATAIAGGWVPPPTSGPPPPTYDKENTPDPHASDADKVDQAAKKKENS